MIFHNGFLRPIERVAFILKRDVLYIAPTGVEDLMQESAWLCSRDIRQHMYGLMGNPPESVITEVIWKTSSTELEILQLQSFMTHL